MAAAAILNLLVPLYLSQFLLDSHTILYVGSLHSLEKYFRVKIELRGKIQYGGVRHFEFTCAVVSQSVFIGFS
jgi:hypothetical protein